MSPIDIPNIYSWEGILSLLDEPADEENIEELGARLEIHFYRHGKKPFTDEDFINLAKIALADNGKYSEKVAYVFEHWVFFNISIQDIYLFSVSFAKRSTQSNSFRRLLIRYQPDPVLQDNRFEDLLKDYPIITEA